MNCNEAYNEGFDQGLGAAKYTEVSNSEIREAGCDHEDDKMCRECATVAAYESENNSRQYSPWEFTAKEINDAGEFRSEQLWEWYDKGVTAGIKKGLSQRFGRKRFLEI